MKVASNVWMGSGVSLLALMVAACSGTQTLAPLTPRATASPTIAPGQSSAPSTSPSPSPSTTGAASPTPSPAPSQSRAPSPTPTPTSSSVACATRALPSSGALLYALGQEPQATAEALSVDAGDFNGSSTAGYSVSGPRLTGTQGGDEQFVSAVALGPGGNVYVGNSPINGTGQVQVYPPNIGCTGPAATLVGSNTGLQSAESVVVDSAGYIYVANAGYTSLYSQQYGEESCPFNTIAMFAPISSGTNNVAPAATIPDPAPTPNCNNDPDTTADTMHLALDANGRIYATSYNTSDVYVFSARSGSTLNSTPVATFEGGIYGTTGIVEPVGIALDASGKIYVSMPIYDQTPNQSGTPAVAVYAPNPQGTMTSGALTAIYGSQPMHDIGSVSVDRNGEVYVIASYNSQQSVLEFPPISQGSSTEAPAGALTGSALYGASSTVVPVALAAH